MKSAKKAKAPAKPKAAPAPLPASATGAAAEKAIKRQILAKPQSALVRFPKGLGDLCRSEVEELLARQRVDGADEADVALTDNSVQLSRISLRSLVALTAQLTTAREVLWVIGEGRAGSIGEIKDRLAQVPWPLLLPPGLTLGVRVASTASHVFHEGKIGELVAKELGKHGLAARAKAGCEHLLDLRLVDDRLTLALSLGGRPLYQRRYKTALAGTATIKEDIAAACVRAALAFAAAQRGGPFRPHQVLVPFAGSGTLGFEAAIALCALPPWLFFGPLSAESFPCTPQATMDFMRRSTLASAQAVASEPLAVAFSDIEPEQVAALQINTAEFNEKLRKHGCAAVAFSSEQADFFTAPVAQAIGPRLIPLNPPFGLRLEDKAGIDRLYPRLARALARSSGEVAGFALAPSAAVAKRFSEGLETSQSLRHETRPFNHGGRTVYLVHFYRPT